MLFYTVGQSRIFLTMLYAGLAIGLYAGLDSAARRLFEAGWLTSLFMDLLLGLAAGSIICLALTAAADGELRLYALMGAACGLLIYQGTVAPLLRRLCRRLARFASALLRRIKNRRFIQKLLR